MYDVWKNALAEIEQQISTANFSTWFQDTSLLSTEDGEIKIGVKNSFYVKQLRNRYLDLIKTALKNNNITVDSIDFEVQSSTKPKVHPREITPTDTVVKSRIKKVKTELTSQPTNTGLNHKYTLDNFVVGSNNDLAVSAARSIIDSPGDRYNPFFLYGGPGLGKTHLMKAVGYKVQQLFPGRAHHRLRQAAAGTIIR